ncbi:unnamed protein product [Didymodactylos carnosus]|uniref:Pirin n=1 Tax=Didymodactylos carnosus TaxID=1234261 RepID=A0A814B1R5_9BILA|nr:unnamed protein product [Didymodactylos carnosus]CAF1043116.1 unnamed protein product [Didymodactylos carnosus]CAF3701226.1 unnamed protein product [Didymodactylos carnosus]CAF3811264.1 unnamed protein product [Didymodactylos carnosus]
MRLHGALQSHAPIAKNESSTTLGLVKEQSEGVGARVRRSIGTNAVKHIDPFLMLDEFSVNAPAGFPDHPHRGFETVTYMLTGSFQHEDFCGHKGVINPGDLQWMTAGRGILHCEMPLENSPITAHGLQLWVNLGREFKMTEPKYQELLDRDIPRATSDDGLVNVKIIAGESMGIQSPVYTITPTMYLDFTVKPTGQFTQSIPNNWNAFCYILSGSGEFGSKTTKADAHNILVLSLGNTLQFKNTSQTSDLRFVLIAGKPLNEPIVQYGPFVMNTQKEIEQALRDFHENRNGFENAAKWRSKAASAH